MGNTSVSCRAQRLCRLRHRYLVGERSRLGHGAMDSLVHSKATRRIRVREPQQGARVMPETARAVSVSPTPRQRRDWYSYTGDTAQCIVSRIDTVCPCACPYLCLRLSRKSVTLTLGLLLTDLHNLDGTRPHRSDCSTLPLLKQNMRRADRSIKRQLAHRAKQNAKGSTRLGP